MLACRYDRVVARGTARLLISLGFCCVSELSLASGRRADLVALGRDGEIWIVEIKSSVADFRADQKWMDYRMHCDRLFFAIPETVDPGIRSLRRTASSMAYSSKGLMAAAMPSRTRFAWTLRS